jgi:hypothetical protein
MPQQVTLGQAEGPGLDVAARITARPAYGVDAPGVVRGFFLAAAALATAGGFAAVLLHRPWSWFAAPLLLAAVPALCLGSSMLLYAFLGKQRLRDHLLRQRVWRGDEVVLDLGAGRGLIRANA